MQLSYQKKTLYNEFISFPKRNMLRPSIILWEKKLDLLCEELCTLHWSTPGKKKKKNPKKFSSWSWRRLQKVLLMNGINGFYLFSEKKQEKAKEGGGEEERRMFQVWDHSLLEAWLRLISSSKRYWILYYYSLLLN